MLPQVPFLQTFFIGSLMPVLFTEKQSFQGEVLDLIRISRTEMGAYLCIASNGVPPSISKRIILTVECKLFGKAFERLTIIRFYSRDTLLKDCSQARHYPITDETQLPNQ